MCNTKALHWCTACRTWLAQLDIQSIEHEYYVQLHSDTFYSIMFKGVAQQYLVFNGNVFAFVRSVVFRLWSQIALSISLTFTKCFQYMEISNTSNIPKLPQNTVSSSTSLVLVTLRMKNDVLWITSCKSWVCSNTLRRLTWVSREAFRQTDFLFDTFVIHTQPSTARSGYSQAPIDRSRRGQQYYGLWGRSKERLSSDTGN